jgi:pilus assembly protein CpaC
MRSAENNRPSRRRRGDRALLLLAIAIAIAALLAPLAAEAKKSDGVPDEPVQVPVNGNKHLKLKQTITRVASGSTDVADVAAFPPDELLITGKRLGNTTVTVWMRDEAVTFHVIVGYPTESILAALAEALPDAKGLKVTSAGTSVVITGRVKDVADVARAEEIVKGFASTGNPGQATATPIVNLLTVDGEQQVQLEVSFAEVSRSGLKEMGMNLLSLGSKDNHFVAGISNPSSALPVEQTGGAALGVPLVPSPLGSTFGLLFGTDPEADYPFSVGLSVLAQNGFARVLAEPTLVALNGEPASFLAGGEFPVPLPQALGQIVIQYKKFGIQLEFTPTIVDETIQLRMALTVSDLDFSLGIKLASVTVPGLTERHASTTVRLRDGQSFAIAGLLSDKVRSSVDKVPLLGDVPILGMLFRSTSYRREETELLVVVTAHLVRPQNERPELPGEGTASDPSDLELFLLGTVESKPGGRVPRKPVGGEPVGPVGFKRR